MKLEPVAKDAPEFDEEKHEYRKDGVLLPSVTQILISQGLIDTTYFKPEHRDRGTRVHTACEILDMGEEPGDDPTITGYLDAYRKFRSDNTDIKWIFSEQSFYHPIHLFAGRPDRVGQIGRAGSVILDIKTGGYYPSYSVQLAGYAQFFIQAQALQLLTLQLSPEGKYKLRQADNPIESHNTFISALNLWRWKQQHLASARRMIA